MSEPGPPHGVDLTVFPDALLVDRVLDGDTEAFREIVHRYGALMRAYVRRIVGSLDEADDVVQNALVTGWRQLHTLQDGAALRSWLMRIASREAFAHLRRRRTSLPLDAYDLAHAHDLPEQSAIRNAQLAALSAALDTLPDNQRRAWLLREFAELSYAEIAEEMDISPSTVRGLLARARTSVAIRMGGWR